jgi:hypothetical protein
MKRTNTHHSGTFLPHFETLEGRTQPGSLLTAGLDPALLASTLDQTAQGTDAGSHQRLNLSLGSFHTSKANAGGVLSVAPAQVTRPTTVTNSSLTLGTNQSSNLGLQNQGLAVAATPRHPSATQGAAPVSTNGQTVSQNQGGRGATFSARAVPLSGSAPAVAVASQPDHLVRSVKATHISGANNGDHPPASLDWSTFLGITGAQVNRVVQANNFDGNLYAVGSVPDPNTGGTDFLVAELTPDGTTLLNMAHANPTSGVNAVGNGIRVDANGNMYVIGTVDGLRTYFRLEQDFATVDRTIQSGVTSNGAGDYLAPDPGSGKLALYITGWTDGTAQGNPKMNIQLSEFVDLDTSNPTNVFGFYYTVAGTQGSTGTNVGVESTGSIFVSGTLIVGSDSYASMNEFSLDGMTGFVSYFITPGPNYMGDVSLDSSDNAFGAGTILDPTSHDTDILVVEYAPGLANIYAFGISESGVNLVGNGVATDGLGNSYAVGAASPDSGTFFQNTFFLKFDGSTATDNGLVGGMTPGGTDVANGVAWDPNLSAAYIVGTTTSPDFPTTPGAYQTIYGGPPSDGFAYRVSSFT